MIPNLGNLLKLDKVYRGSPPRYRDLLIALVYSTRA